MILVQGTSVGAMETENFLMLQWCVWNMDKSMVMLWKKIIQMLRNWNMFCLLGTVDVHHQMIRDLEVK